MTSVNSANDAVVVMHWFRKGLRLHDNPALLHALSLVKANKNEKKSLGQIYPVYVVDPNCYQLLKCSVMRARFLLECVEELDNNLRELGSRLFVVSGDPVEVLPQLWADWNINFLTYEADETKEPYAVERDQAVREAASKVGVAITEFASETLRPLGNSPGGYVAKLGGSTKKVPTTMSSFLQLFESIDRGTIPLPLPSPTKEDFPPLVDKELDETFLPFNDPCRIPWPRGYHKSEIDPVWNRTDSTDNSFTPLVKGGETSALQKLNQSVTSRPDWAASFEKPTTSCTEVVYPSTTVLSPFLSLGCLSPRTAWHAILVANKNASPKTSRSKPPVSLHGQLLWRDFNNLMAHSANTQVPGSWGRIKGNPFCRDIPWSSDQDLIIAWKEGKTGYPWIDACMIQLRTQGWIHHLGRHAVACFLTRGDLWQSWEKGADHFEGQLLDADYALNNFNWLWLSCSGFFYQYFRCYSPVAFQKKNDPNGNYIRKWLPQLAKLPSKYIYEPWKAPMAILNSAGVKLGENYPRPIVDHAYASKENMSKMSLAYDMHRDIKDGESKVDTKKSKGRAMSTVEPSQKKQIKLK